MRRIFDILFSIVVLVLTSPIFLITALAIKLSSRGPVLFLAKRMGKDGNEFRMFKFRSMHINNGGSEITATNDRRVFAVGRIIRKLKIDELPQFINVIKGEMAVVGPRPESPAIVAAHYTHWMRETLQTRPGLTSPGAIFYYAFGDEILDNDDPERAYVEKLLAPKLALELAYTKRATLVSDIVVIFHTALAIIGKALGKSIPPLRRDVEMSKTWSSDPVLDFVLRPKSGVLK